MATPKTRQFEKFYPENRIQWREWLDNNHETSEGVWIIYYKKHTNQPTISYDEAVEEALCFGWIDSIPNKIDGDKYMQLFSPRKKKSPWSKLNKQRIERLLKTNKMMPAGLKKIEAARNDGSWTLLDKIEELMYPEDFASALNENHIADKNFRNFSKSYIKGILWWIESAKRPETRQKRINKIIESAAKNEKHNP